MQYNRQIQLKNGMTAVLRSGLAYDAEPFLDMFFKCRTETDFLIQYPDEIRITPEQEAAFLREKFDSADEVELIALIGDKIVGCAGISPVGRQYKLRHRAEFGIHILKEYWGMGLGTALTDACIRCARESGYTQLELEVAADNERAIALYKKAGFIEYGRNPGGMRLRFSGCMETVLMYLPL